MQLKWQSGNGGALSISRVTLCYHLQVSAILSEALLLVVLCHSLVAPVSHFNYTSWALCGVALTLTESIGPVTMVARPQRQLRTPGRATEKTSGSR